jgi:hypothetical protein
VLTADEKTVDKRTSKCEINEIENWRIKEVGQCISDFEVGSKVTVKAMVNIDFFLIVVTVLLLVTLHRG